MPAWVTAYLVHILLSLFRSGIPVGSPGATTAEWAAGALILHAAVSSAAREEAE